MQGCTMVFLLFLASDFQPKIGCFFRYGWLVVCTSVEYRHKVIFPFDADVFIRRCQLKLRLKQYRKEKPEGFEVLSGFYYILLKGLRQWFSEVLPFRDFATAGAAFLCPSLSCQQRFRQRLLQGLLPFCACAVHRIRFQTAER